MQGTKSEEPGRPHIQRIAKLCSLADLNFEERRICFLKTGIAIRTLRLEGRCLANLLKGRLRRRYAILGSQPLSSPTKSRPLEGRIDVAECT
jgi:hypothetical protein